MQRRPPGRGITIPGWVTRVLPKKPAVGAVAARSGDSGSGRPGPEFGEVTHEAHVTYRLETVRCGKAACQSCPHGPYWYAYWREDGKLRSRYVGKERPEGATDPDAATLRATGGPDDGDAG
jgi:hypothetical protein